MQTPALPSGVQRTLKDTPASASEEDAWGPWASHEADAEVLSEVVPGAGRPNLGQFWRC